ncbi:peptide chain release factor 2 [Candidatus Poribacteria bacterium]|nr:peptide chain release factor 2 [Candidatus Poribacteria bacterium]
MLPEINAEIERMRNRIIEIGGHLDISEKQKQIEQIEKEMSDPGFWNDSQQAQQTSQQLARLKEDVEIWESLNTRIEDAETLLEMAEEEGDSSLHDEIKTELSCLGKELDKVEFKIMLSGEHDRNNAILEIHSGAGGTEAQDWAEMLLRMYLRWCESKGYQTQSLDTIPGEEAGIKSTTIIVKGEYAYGYLKAEVGVHRLVRISPFDSGHRRHTSFASVFVYPDIEDDIEIEINDQDIRVDTFRSGGPGGQHVNVTDSAVRITHISTGIVVQCQNERSQHRNREMAMKVLRARLYEYELEKQNEEMAKLQGEKRDIAFGNQIRSYVFHPYRMVKDLRTNVEMGDVDRVMDGYLDPFIEAWLLNSSSKNND